MTERTELATEITRTEWRGAVTTVAADFVAREEPLEIRLNGVPIAVVMRTPGDDENLVRGFLLTEGIVPGPAAVASIRPCTIAEPPEAEGNVMQVVLAAGVDVDIARVRRNLYTTSSCGVCGKASLEQALRAAPPLDDASRVASEVLYALPGRLAAAQEGFAETGGLHAAGLFTLDGEPLVVREDVGRHNAVDKVVGWAATHGAFPAVARILVVSGRVSFEIAQKALAARVPIVAAVSAPSSLAVELARAGGLTLVGFLRDERMCLYAGAERVVQA